MNTPTPRTDAVYLEHRHWANEDEATEAIEDFRDLARTLERELAAERARLRQIALDACRSAKITPIVWYPKRYAIDPNDFGIINEQQVEACAQAIDAAMKEETK